MSAYYLSMTSVVLKRSREAPTNSDTSTIHLRCVGFCGADDTVEPALLSAISLQHNWVEWGVLFRPEKAGLPRFASEMWLAQLATVNAERTMRLAGHLCSTRVDELLQGDTGFVSRMHHELGFTRFQINATAANGCDTSLFSTDAAATETVTRLRAAFATLPHLEFIVQRNESTRALWERLLEAPPPNMSLLFDDSMGLGVSATSWPYAAPLASSQLARSRHGPPTLARSHALSRAHRAHSLSTAGRHHRQSCLSAMQVASRPRTSRSSCTRWAQRPPAEHCGWTWSRPSGQLSRTIQMSSTPTRRWRACAASSSSASSPRHERAPRPQEVNK